MSAWAALGYMWPEVIVFLTGTLILVLDLIWPATSSEEGALRSRGWLAGIGIAGLVAAAVAVSGHIGVHKVLFGGIFIVDSFSVYFSFLFLGIGALILLLSIRSVPLFSKWTAEFYAFVVWCTLGHMILASSGELFTIFVTLQLTSLPLIVLIGYAKRDTKSTEASVKYLLLVLVSTAVLVYGMSLIYGSLGTSVISEIGVRLSQARSIETVLGIGLVLLLTGFAFKITAAPFHYWVPDTYEGAPSPVTAFMSVGSKFAGFALALRLLTQVVRVPIDWHLVFGVMAVLSMTLGNLGAIRQTNIKRMLAYSGIAQAGYLLIGVAALSSRGFASLLFYALCYILANLAAFGVVIVFGNATGSSRIEDFAGLSRRAPLAALTSAIALLSLAGLPFMAGFTAKFYVFLSAAQSGLVWLVVIGVLNSVISLYYYLRVVYVMYVQQGDTDRIAVDPSSAIAMSLCTVGVLALGVFPEYAIRAANVAAAALFGR